MDGPVLAVIPARGGSKGIPGKNIRLMNGRPLLAYAIEAARSCKEIDRIVLSTDSAEIAEVGRRWGVEPPFLRPSDLSGDEAPMGPVLEHAVAWVEARGGRPGIVVLLQPTAPLRRPEHISAALALLRSTGCDSVASVVEVPRHHSPDYVMRVEQGRLVPFLDEEYRVTRRQDARPAYARDGTVYAVRRDVLMQTHSLYGNDCRPLVLSPEETLTLDTLSDWSEAERRLGRRVPGAQRT